MRDCPKRLQKLGTEASQTAQTGPRSSISLLETTRIEAPVPSLAPFRTVSLGSSVNRGEGWPGTLCQRLDAVADPNLTGRAHIGSQTAPVYEAAQHSRPC